jgi:hypothetical protein
MQHPTQRKVMKGIGIPKGDISWIANCRVVVIDCNDVSTDDPDSIRRKSLQSSNQIDQGDLHSQKHIPNKWLQHDEEFIPTTNLWIHIHHLLSVDCHVQFRLTWLPSSNNLSITRNNNFIVVTKIQDHRFPTTIDSKCARNAEIVISCCLRHGHPQTVIHSKWPCIDEQYHVWKHQLGFQSIIKS